MSLAENGNGMVMRLEQRLKNARSEEERKAIMECINDLER